jgi:hypothetical protein
MLIEPDFKEPKLPMERLPAKWHEDDPLSHGNAAVLANGAEAGVICWPSHHIDSSRGFLIFFNVHRGFFFNSLLESVATLLIVKPQSVVHH